MTVTNRPRPVPQHALGSPPPLRPSTFAAKLTMAVTGLLFTAFVAVHMVGNLKAYAGAADYNAYAAWLRSAFAPLLPHEGLLWAMRVVLGTALVLHVAAGTLLWVRGRRFRGPHRRRGHTAIGARTMLPTGFVLLAFVVFHLLDLTLGIAGPAAFRAPTATESFAYENTVASLARPLAGAAYLVTMLALALHLAHGLWTTANDLGVTATRTRATWKALGYTVGVLVALGNASLPVAVWLGVLR